MELYDCIATRRSIRKYSDEPVPREVIDRVLEAGRLAPSWKNRQCWRFILVSDPDIKRQIGMVVDNPSQEVYQNAPYVLVLCADPTDSGTMAGKDYYLVDCGICMEHVVLSATAEGLGSCWVGYFPENPLRALLGIPRDTRIVALTPLGYAAEAPEARERQELSKMVHEDGWRQGG